MAHYAYIDENNIVTQVIVGKDEDDLPEGIDSWEEYFSNKGKGRCLRTSYNTAGNEHINEKVPFRGNFAKVGGTYDESLDVFIDPKPFNSWILNQQTFTWEAPEPLPADSANVEYFWNEDLDNWSPVV